MTASLAQTQSYTVTTSDQRLQPEVSMLEANCSNITNRPHYACQQVTLIYRQYLQGQNITWTNTKETNGLNN